MKVYVVHCTYDGCEDCGRDGGHVVGVTFDKDKAVEMERAHDADKTEHYGHFHCASVEEFEVEIPAPHSESTDEQTFYRVKTNIVGPTGLFK